MKEPKTVEIVVGREYEFVSEVEQEQLPEEDRLCRYTGQRALVLKLAGDVDDECSPLYDVRFPDGREAQAWEEELSGWDKALGQYFRPDGTYAGDSGDVDERAAMQELKGRL